MYPELAELYTILAHIQCGILKWKSYYIYMFKITSNILKTASLRTILTCSQSLHLRKLSCSKSPHLRLIEWLTLCIDNGHATVQKLEGNVWERCRKSLHVKILSCSVWLHVKTSEMIRTVHWCVQATIQKV